MDQLKAVFLAEAEELVGALEKALLAFEQDTADSACVKDIFRVMHTLKGSASMFGHEHLSSLTHSLETIYDEIREDKRTATAEVLEVTLRSLDHIKSLLRDPQLHAVENQACQADIMRTLEEMSYSAEASSASEKRNGSATYYIAFTPEKHILDNGTNILYLVDDLVGLGNAIVLPRIGFDGDLKSVEENTCFTSFEIILHTAAGESAIREVFLFVEDYCKISIEELSKEDLTQNPQFRLLVEKDDAFFMPHFGFSILSAFVGQLHQNDIITKSKASVSAKAESGTSIRVSSDKLDELMNLVSELVTSQARLSLIAEQNGIADLSNVSENIEKITRRLRDNAFSICLVPIESVVTRYQRLVRDLSKELGKEVAFVAEGTDTELDKSIIEKITDPLLHILRNALDHGIEKPDERLRSGKRREGTVRLKASHSGTHVVIEISDDGKGMDIERIRHKAIDKGMISPEQAISEKELLQFVFLPAFSTAEKLSDVSGRGVGMDVVKRNIEGLHGEVSVESELGRGTTISIRLPLTLSIMDGMLVRIADFDYIVPLNSVDKCYEIETATVKNQTSQKVALDGSLLPLFNLREVFNEGYYKNPVTQVIKLNYPDFPVAITVDAIIGEYQAVMKPLGELYQSQDEYSGATILGDGTVALVLDTDKLVRRLVHLSNN